MKCALKYLGIILFIFIERFDIILDDTLKPWLLEVNHAPSFTCDTPLDYEIKRHLIIDSLILVNIKNKEKSL